MSGVELSALDTRRWGVRTAKAGAMTRESLPEALAYCRTEGVGFLIARCDSEDLDAAHAMEREGFQLMDTLVYYSRDLARPVADDGASPPIRSLRHGEEASVRDAARESFAGYSGHYHADPRLDRLQCDETYVDWAHRSSLAIDAASDVLVAERSGRIVAFATLRLNTAEESEGVLFGVTPPFQGQGLYRALILAGMHWGKTRRASRMVVSTQVTNIAVQKVWTRLGFEPCRSCYTFHRWF